MPAHLPERVGRRGMSQPAALRLVDVTKRYPAGYTVGPVSLEIGKGEFFSLLGESGSGKTTLLRCIAGFETLTAGTIALGGEPIHTRPPHLRNVGLVFQNYALFPHRTVYENVAYGLKLRKRPPAEIAERVGRILEMVGMPDLGGRYPSQISGGQQQRVAIARSLILEPPLVLFDEPLSNLDAKLRVQLRFELRALQRRLGMTCIFVTHDQSEALALSDRIAVLAKGQVVQVGSPTDIYQRPNSLFVAEFVGSSNRLPATLEHADQDGSHVRTLGGLALQSSARTQADTVQLVAMFRPEEVEILPSSVTEAPNRFACEIADLTYLGEDTHLQLIARASGERLLATFKSHRRWAGLAAGDEVVAAIDPAAVRLFGGP
mgnify:CR=1 FL=1